MKQKNIFGLAHLKFRFDYFLLISALLLIAIGITGIVLRRPEKQIPTLYFTQWWHNDLDIGVLESLIAEYEESREEDIKIVLDYRSYEEVRKLLFDYKFVEVIDPETGETVIEQPEFPGDILALDQLWIRSLYENNILDSSVPPTEPLISFFSPFYYNTEVLRNAGFLRPPRNRSELLSYAAEVTNPGEGRYGIGFALGEQNSKGVYQEIYPWFWASGVSLIAGGRNFTETFDFFSRLREGNVIHPQSLVWGEKEKREAFINNRIAFMIGPVQDIEILRRQMGEDAFSIGIIPGADTYLGKPAFGASDWSLGIFKDSRYREEAADFISFLQGKSSFLSDNAHVISPRNLSLEYSDYSEFETINARPLEAYIQDDDPLYSKAWELLIAGDFITELEQPFPAPAGNTEMGAAERDAVFREELLGLFGETHTPASAAGAVRERWGL